MDGGTTRRGLLKIAGSLAFVSSSPGALAQIDSELSGDDGADIYGLILDAGRPSQAQLDREWDTYRLIHVHPKNGVRAKIAHDADGWEELPTSLKPYQFTGLPSNPSLGQLVFDEDHGTPAWYDDAHGWEWPNFVDAVLTTPQTVANTTTRTSVFTPMLNADSLIQGRIYQLDLQGTFSTANTSDTFEVDVDLAGTDVAELQNEPANVTDAVWTLELTFTVRSHGATGELKANSRATFQEQPRTASHAPITVDTTTATTLDVFIVWSAADPANTVTLEQAHLKEMA